MFFRLVYDDALAQAAYLIGCQRTGQALVIDPQRDVDRYLDLAERNGLRITAVAETHIHADFLSGARELGERCGATVYVSAEGGPDWQYAWLTQKAGGGEYADQRLRDGATFRIGEIELRAIHTPGHTPEHLCFLVTDRGAGATDPLGIATGDFVFVGDLGRPDLLETAAGQAGATDAAARALLRSVPRFTSLPEFLQVWPGHGAGSACGKALGAVPQSTVGYEKRFNPAILQAADESRFLRSIIEGQPEPPLYFARMKRLNRDGPPLLGRLPDPAELSPTDLARVDGHSTSVVDTRTWAEFRGGHLAGALYCPVGASFPTDAGSMLDEHRDIVLVVARERRDAAIRMLIRIGLDRITGWTPPETLAAIAKSSGAALVRSEEFSVPEARRQIADGAFVLDVRRATEYAEGHIAGARNIAHTRLAAHLQEIPQGRPIIVHCLGGGRSARAVSLLERAGRRAANLAGGMNAWQQAGAPVVR
jgi:hydroxyacylglutathione hydrolase